MIFVDLELINCYWWNVSRFEVCRSVVCKLLLMEHTLVALIYLDLELSGCFCGTDVLSFDICNTGNREHENSCLREASPAVAATPVSHDETAQNADGEEEDGQEDSAAGEVVLHDAHPAGWTPSHGDDGGGHDDVGVHRGRGELRLGLLRVLRRVLRGVLRRVLLGVGLRRVGLLTWKYGIVATLENIVIVIMMQTVELWKIG